MAEKEPGGSCFVAIQILWDDDGARGRHFAMQSGMEKQDQPIVAVLTGDIVNSTAGRSFEANYFLTKIQDYLNGNVGGPSITSVHGITLWRGDEFRGLFEHPVGVLRSMVMVRALMRSGLISIDHLPLDARIVGGIGRDSYLQESSIEGTGEAFVRSGRGLDDLKKKTRDKRRMIIVTGNDEFDAEMEVQCALLDEVIGRWTPEMAEAMFHRLSPNGLSTQAGIAECIGPGIHQTAISKRLIGAGEWAVKKAVERFEAIIDGKIM